MAFLKTTRTSNDADDARPLTAYESARRTYFDATGEPVVRAQQFFVATVGMGALLLLAIVALILLLPLKRVEPWVIAVREDGAVSTGAAAAVPLRDWTPSRAVLDRELNEWVRALMAVNAEYPKIVEADQRRAFARARRAAVDQFREYIAKTDPYGRMRSDRTLLRTVQRNTVTYREAGFALVRVTTTERGSGLQTPQTKRWLVTLSYEFTPPSSTDELGDNPLGLYITQFEVEEERS